MRYDGTLAHLSISLILRKEYAMDDFLDEVQEVQYETFCQNALLWGNALTDKKILDKYIQVFKNL
jgi:hypothetical protein